MCPWSFAYLLKIFLFRSFDYFNQFNFLYHWKFLLFFLDTKPLSDIQFMNIFLLYVNCLCLLYCIPCPEIIHKFQQSPIYLFFLCCFCLGIIFKKPCSNPMLWRFMLMSLKCFIVLVLILRYLIYSELSFACEGIAVDTKKSLTLNMGRPGG